MLFVLYTYIAIFIHIHTVHRHTRVCTYIYLCTLYMYILHAWTFLGGLGVLGVLDMFSRQRSTCLVLFHVFPTLVFRPKSHRGESTCSGIPALSQRRENCLNINVGLKGHVFIAVFKQMCNWCTGLAAFCQYSVSHYSCKLTGSSGSWMFSNYPFPASCLLI